MKKVIFKTIALFLSFTYVFNLCLHDISFAQETQSASASESGQSPAVSGDSIDSQDKQDSSHNSKTSQAANISSLAISPNTPPDYHQYLGSSGFNLSVLQSFQADIFTGQTKFSIPIVSPSGRKGIQPNISLNYSSDLSNGILGIGWALELGSIERSTKKGVPKYDLTDTFVFNSGGSSSELVSIGGSEYRPKIEGGFSKFYFDGASWTITDKTGIKYYFGQTASSRQESGSKIFKWCLDKVLDRNGNYLTITYTQDQGQVYPNQIHYTGNEVTADAPTNQIDFIFEARADPLQSYRNGTFRVYTALRLSEILIKSNNQQLSRYQFLYTYSSYTNRSLLTTVREYGADDITTLPDITFNYQSGSPGWELASGWSIPADTYFSSQGSWLYDMGVRLVDVNADGFTDIVKSVTNLDGTTSRITYLNDKNKSFINAQRWVLPTAFTFIKLSNGNQDNAVRFMDINADGWIDVVRYIRYASGGVVENKVYLNNFVSGWALSSTWKLPEFTSDLEIILKQPSTYEYRGVVLEDINGDGIADYVKAKGTDRRSYINDGKGSWQTNTNNELIDGDFTQGANLIDLNGDGFNDLFIGESSRKIAYLNTGLGWVRDSLYDLSSVNLSDGSTQFVDVNSDGLPDALYAKEGVRATYINTGDRLSTVADPNWQMPEGDFTHLDTRFLDANADGLMDFLVHFSGQAPKLYLNKAGVFPDLLSNISNGIGGQIQLSYKPSTLYDNTGVDNVPDLPFPVQTLTSSTISDNQGNSTTTTYAYRDGSYDLGDREFRGFGYIKVTDAEGNFTENYFKQDDTYKGKLSKQESKDKLGNLYSKVENLWNSFASYPGVNFVYLSQTYNYTYDGDASYKLTYTRFEYDTYGNPTRIMSEGDVNITTDKKTQVIDYVYNTTDWLVAFPKRTYLLDQNQVKVSEKYFYYDNATAYTTAPTKGLLTQEKSLLYNPLTLTGSYINTNYAYDSYGNLTTTVDALGRYTTISYDTLVHSYPIKVTNPLGHIVNTVYYGINEPITDTIIGSGLVGQVKSTEDPNKQKAYNIYDTLGRLIKVIGPNDTEAYPGVIYEYDLTLQPIKLTKKVKIDYASPPNYLVTYQFFDGLGRLIQTKSPVENDPVTGLSRQVISDIVKFDTRGQVKEKYFPYFVDDSSSYVIPTYTTPKTTFTYDPLARPIQITNPDLTYSTVSYSDWVTTSTDENGHYKTSYSDAYGRITKIEEHEGTQTFTTTYEYDTQGNLTKVTDNQANVTQIWYDSLGRKLKMDDPDMGIWTYEYDSVGNLTKQTDAKAQVLEFKYDKLNRLTQKLYNGLIGVFYEYDNVSKGNCIGRLSKVTSLNDTTEFFYDNLGRETKSTKAVNGIYYTVERTYDAIDRLMTLKYPDGDTVTYIYNPQGIEKVEGLSPQGTVPYISNIDYSATSQITKIINGNGTETTYTYDPNTLRLTNLTTQAGLTKIQDLNYQFDNVGNIKSITDWVNTASQSFLYDDLDRLIQASGSYGIFTYTYDSIGNMTSKEGVTLTYGKLGKLPHAVTQYGSTLIDYDSNGNMLKKGNTTLTYDIENRLIQVKESSSKYTTILYDGDGGRVKKYAGDGQQYIDTTYIGSLYEVVTQPAQSIKTRKHIFAGANRICTQGLSPQGTVPVLSYYHSDHLGSSNVITDQNGTQTGLTEFTPYGSTFKQTGTYNPKHKFTGKELDSTGLYFYGARYYDPELGRFITADPTIQRPYDPQDLNRYSYVRNNPINLTDPSGLGWFKKFWKKFTKVIIAAVTAAAVVFTWGALAPGLTAMGALFSTSGAVIVSSAAASTAVLNTGEGRQFQRRLGSEVFDDIFGMRPSTARIFGSIGAYMLTNMAFQFGFARLYGANRAITDIKDASQDKLTTESIVREGKGSSYGTRPRINPKTGELEHADKLYYSGNEAVGVGTESLNIFGKPEHIGIVLKGLQTNLDAVSFFQHPFKAISQGYFIFGTSHQPVNMGLLNVGINTTVIGLGGGYTTLLTTFVYGPYGGGLTGAVTFEQIKDK